MDELRECPLCGSTDVTTKTSAAAVPGGLTMILCWGCGATVSFDQKERKEQAITAWNTRAGDAEIARLMQTIRQKMVVIERQQDRMNKLETDIKAGRLLDVPARIGDKVYMHDWREEARKSIYSGIVTGFTVNRSGLHMEVRTDGNSNFAQNNNWNGGSYSPGSIGDTIFFTREEAVAALEKEG